MCRLLTDVRLPDGTFAGRAASLKALPNFRDLGVGNTEFVSVGGLSYPLARFTEKESAFSFCGILFGDTIDVTRRGGVVDFPREAVGRVLSEQALLIESDKYLVTQLADFAQYVVNFDGNPGKLPICFLGGAVVNFEELCEFLELSDEVLLLIGPEAYERNYRFLPLEKISVNLLSANVADNIIVFYIGSYGAKVFDDNSYRRGEYKSGVRISASELDFNVDETFIFNAVSRVWGSYEIEFWSGEIFKTELLSAKERHALKIRRVRG